MASATGEGPRSWRRLTVPVAAVVLSLGLLAAACGQDAPGVSSSAAAEEVRSSAPRVDATAEQAAPAVTATAGLGADLYRRLAAAQQGNLVLSPASIEIALAMTRNGAKGPTRTQMDAVLHAGEGSTLDTGLNGLDRALTARNGHKERGERSGDVAVETANALWAQKGFTFDDVFLGALARDYGAGVNVVDFRADAEAGRTRINTWAAAKTHDKIKDLIPQGAVDPDTRLVLTNAVYFKAPWAQKFAKLGAKPFTKADGSFADVPTIAGGGTAAGGTYGEGEGWKAAELPYLGGELSMVVIVPDDLAAFEGALDGDRLQAITGALRDPLRKAQLPTFTFRTALSLKEQLGALGMPLAFTDTADFSAMTTADEVWIGDVLHQAFIAVDEEGTEAAAATAVVMVAGAAPRAPEGAELIADRPFLFAIRDVPTGAILFLGRVTDPAPA
jgi:serpin B